MSKNISTDAEISSIFLKEAAAPDTPASGYGQLYEKTDGKIYFKNDAGTETRLDEGDSTTTDTEANKPAAGNNGNLFLPSNGFYVWRDTGAAWSAWGPLFPFTAPVLGDFAWVNQDAATAVATNGGIYLQSDTDSSTEFRVLKKAAPATPYTITAAIIPNMTDVNYNSCGLCWRQSSDGKMVVAHCVISKHIYVDKETDAENAGANYADIIPYFAGGIIWLRIADNGTNRIVSFSLNGVNFIQIHSVGRTDFMTADEVGFCVNSQNATYAAGMTLLSWKEE